MENGSLRCSVVSDGIQYVFLIPQSIPPYQVALHSKSSEHMPISSFYKGSFFLFPFLQAILSAIAWSDRACISHFHFVHPDPVCHML